MRNAARFLLHAIREITAETLAGSQRLNNGAHMMGRCDDQNLVQARANELANRVPKHRLLSNREQVFVRDLRKRAQA